MKYLVILLLAMGSLSETYSQNSGLIIPLEHQQAIQNGTRTNTGVPGASYFQNRADYVIEAEFDPATCILTGKEKIKYQNSSPDTLKWFVIRLYQNLFKPESLRNVEIDPEDFTQGVEVTKLVIGEKTLNPEKFRYLGTNLTVGIPGKLFPSSSVDITVEWKVQLPKKTNLRMGKYGDGSYFVAYWYPRIAVYDDINGWTYDSYTGVHEFYNDYGNYNVKITVPEKHSVWATGVLQNKSDLYTTDIVNRISKSEKSDDVVEVITADDYTKNNVFKTTGPLTWHYLADNVTDFVFGVSNNYLWDAAGTVVDSKTGRRAVVNAVYATPNGKGIAEIGRNTIKSLSDKLIGVPYPYPHNTVWEGNGGMEFPMMCNDGPVEELFEKVFVTSHEISHSYFPFMVGTNESLYAWMDEGLITFIPKAIELESGNKNAHYYVGAYGARTMGTIYDMPLIIPSTEMTQGNYMMQNYGRAAAGFYFLRDAIGDEMFKNVLKEFVLRWQGKHPLPMDFVNTLNSVTGKDWSWFWNPWFYEFGYADLALENVSSVNNELNLVVRKKGKFPVPVEIKVNFEDKTSETIKENLVVWKDSDTYNVKKKFTKKVVSVELGGNNIPDAFPENNVYKF